MEWVRETKGLRLNFDNLKQRFIAFRTQCDNERRENVFNLTIESTSAEQFTTVIKLKLIEILDVY